MIRIAIAIGVLALPLSVVGQDAPNGAAPKAAEKRESDFREAHFEKSAQRQSNWIDESAIPAGAQVTPAPSPSASADFSPSAPEIRKYIAAMADAALAADGLTKASDLLSDADRARIAAKFRTEEQRQYNELIQQFRAQFKARYGEEFDLARHAATLNEYRVLRGALPPDKAVIVAFQSGNGTERPAQSQQDQTANLAAERSATVVIPPQPELNQPPLSLTLTNEASGATDWRLDTPDTLSAQQLQQNLRRRLGNMLDGQARWPADTRDAYRAVAYHVLAAFADQPVDRPQEKPKPADHPLEADNPSLES